MDCDSRMPAKPRRRRREKDAALDPNVVDVGPGTKWQLPFKKKDVDTLVSSEADIAAAVKAGGWKAGALILYRDFIREEKLDPSELQGKDLSCTCTAFAGAASLKKNKPPVLRSKFKKSVS
jgi:hypothetical protein